MVYLDIYDTIFEYLEQIEIVDSVFEYSENILRPLIKKNIANEMHNDLILEFALFHYWYKNQILIDFLEKKLYKSLNDVEKKDFTSIKESDRHNLTFIKKIKLNEIDTKKLELYDVYLKDMDTNEIFIVVSSTPLEENKFIMNARLVKHPIREGRYVIIGGIFEKKVYKTISDFCSTKRIKDNIDESKEKIQNLLKFSKEHSLKEIKEYEDKQSKYIRQDKKIMHINKQFFNKFNIGIDDFLNNFFELSNNQALFVEKAEFYLSILKELKNAIFQTSYLFQQGIWHEDTLIKTFLAFIKKDFKLLEENIKILQEEEKQEFESSRKNELALTKEKIMEHNKKWLLETIAPLHLSGFDVFFKRVNDYSAEQFKKFLKDSDEYLSSKTEELDSKMNNEQQKSNMMAHLAGIKFISKIPYELPSLKQVENAQKDLVYNPEIFYEYVDASPEIISLCTFLFITHLTYKKELNKAYQLMKQTKIYKTQSFDQMFLLGRLLSFFEDEEYKTFFKKAKETDKARYKQELEIFLKQKEQKVLVP